MTNSETLAKVWFLMTENDCWYIDGNKVMVYPMQWEPYPHPSLYSRPIDGLSLYKLLRKGDWSVFLSDTDPIFMAMSINHETFNYKIERQEFDKFLGPRYKQELDWRKCGF